MGGTKVYVMNAGGLAFLEGESKPCMAKLIICIVARNNPKLGQSLADYEQTYKYMQTSGYLTSEPFKTIVMRPPAMYEGPSKKKVAASLASASGLQTVDVMQFYLDSFKDESL